MFIAPYVQLVMGALARAIDVLVVGLGPVGATIGCLLGRYGVSTLVVDKSTELWMAPRAIALDNEALRILQMAGLGSDAFDKVVIPKVRMVCPYMGEFACFDSSGSVDGHPKLVTFYQPELERALRAQLTGLPQVSVACGLTLMSFEERAEHVVASLRDERGNTHHVCARFLVGADGAASTVRQILGAGFDGQTYAEDWLIVDARHARRPIDHVEFLCDHRRPVAHMVAPAGRERWEFMLRPGETREQMESIETLRALLAPWGSPDHMEIERKAVYRFHARVCQHFQKGRVFLAGDAAHVTPPFAGQGLVAGLRDAANLCWKLALVLMRNVSPAILTTYDEERRPHAKDMIALAQALGRLIMPRNRLTAMLLHGSVRQARAFPQVRQILDEMKLKPPHHFGRGLFVAAQREDRLTHGRWLPQGWIAVKGSAPQLSDDVLGPGLACIGFGFDPEARLDEATRTAFRRLGGRFLQLGARSGVVPMRANAFDVPGDALLASAAEAGWVAVVRPDRAVLHDGPAKRTVRVVRDAISTLERSSALLVHKEQRDAFAQH
jgi:3-(3-hydroxy-phenyl)propionate hydroxylase